MIRFTQTVIFVSSTHSNFQFLLYFSENPYIKHYILPVSDALPMYFYFKRIWIKKWHYWPYFETDVYYLSFRKGRKNFRFCVKYAFDLFTWRRGLNVFFRSSYMIQCHSSVCMSSSSSSTWISHIYAALKRHIIINSFHCLYFIFG